jgi:hypothetical protein
MSGDLDFDALVRPFVVALRAKRHCLSTAASHASTGLAEPRGGYLQVLAALARSVCESEYSTVAEVDRVDTTLDLATARDLYGWD